MEPENRNQEQQPKKPLPSPGELYQGWKSGGKSKLKEMLEQMPEENDEDE